MKEREASQCEGREREEMAEGYLYKQGAFVRNWKRRWFVLSGCHLSYYEGSNSKKLLGVIDIDTSTAITPHDAPPVGLSQCPTGSVDFCFSISQNAKGRVFYLVGDSKESMMHWVTTLRQVRS